MFLKLFTSTPSWFPAWLNSSISKLFSLYREIKQRSPPSEIFQWFSACFSEETLFVTMLNLQVYSLNYQWLWRFHFSCWISKFYPRYKSVSNGKMISGIDMIIICLMLHDIFTVSSWIHVYDCAYTAQPYWGYISSAGLCSHLACQIFVNLPVISTTINNSFLPAWTKQCYHRYKYRYKHQML